MKTKTTYSTCAAVVALLISTASAFAGDSSKTAQCRLNCKPSAAVSSGSGSAVLQGELGVDVVSGYMFRGTLLDSNLSYQPSLTLSVPISLPGLDKAAVRLNTIQAFNQNSPNAGWFRSEVDIGFALSKAGLTVAPSYQLFSSPTSRFQSAQGFNVRVEYDDSTLTGFKVALKPYVSGFYGTEGNAANGTKPGSYYEVGVAPTAKVGTTTFSVPFAAGFGTRGYYANNQSHGFTSVGLTASTPITQNLSFNAALRYWQTAANLNANDPKSMVCTSVGLALAF